jgi:dolichol-phosphate mannosyltransferase
MKASHRELFVRGRRITVVSPVYNERDNVVALVDALAGAFEPLPYELTVLLVNDGSDAETTDILDGLAASRPSVVVVHLSRNFGHQAALTAGLDAADGDAVVTMDSDLQHPVEIVPLLLERWEQGADVVHTVREGEQEGLFKRLSSAWYYRVMRLASPTPIIPHAADFRLFDAKVVAVLRQMTERARFLRGMSVWVGFRSAEVGFRVAPRRSGRTKYTLGKMVRFGLDGIVSLSSLPLYIGFYVGFTVAMASLVYLLYVLGVYVFTDRAVAGWSSMMVALLFLSGVQIVLMGVLGLYIGRIYDEVRGRPTYIVARRSDDA